MALGQHLSTQDKKFLENKDRWTKQYIPDIPIMLNNKGEIVCIPKEEEVFAAAIVGSSGVGKTLLANRLVSSLYYQWGCNLAMMNDVSEETYHWSEPMSNLNFNADNKRQLNQNPISTPIVYVYPHTKDVNIALRKGRKKFYLKVALPFEEIIEDIGFYLSGVSPDFELGKSEMYVNKLKDKLKECSTPTDILEVLKNELPEEKGFRAMRVKIITAFERLLKEEILDITNPECHSYLRMRSSGFRSNPFSVLMMARRVPSFITSDLSNKKYKSAVFAYYIKELFQNNLKDFPGEKTFLYLDELRTVCEKDTEPAAKAVGDVAARGRINNIGLIYATQFYDRIPGCVKGAKLNYCFAFAHNSSSILNEIGQDFDMDKKLKDRVKRLKQFEVVALTNNKFVCYRNGEKYDTRDPQVGKIFFPLANHKKAGVKG